MADAVTVAFYASPGLVSAIVRWDTRRLGQSWREVPSHCAIVQDGVLHEMISAGYHSRDEDAADRAWSYPVHLTDPDAACHFLDSQYRRRYGWLTIAEIILCRLCPQKWFRSTRGQRQQDCSWLVKAALEAGGWACPEWLRAQYQPASPNDILFAVRGTMSKEKGNSGAKLP